MTQTDLQQIGELLDIKLDAKLDAKLSGFATKEYLDEKLSGFATKEYLDEKLSGFATKEYLDDKLRAFATKEDLIGLESRINEKFVTKEYLDVKLDEKVEWLATIIQEQFQAIDQRFNRIEIALDKKVDRFEIPAWVLRSAA
jgi:hypothetical protein